MIVEQQHIRSLRARIHGAGALYGYLSAAGGVRLTDSRVAGRRQAAPYHAREHHPGAHEVRGEKIYSRHFIDDSMNQMKVKFWKILLTVKRHDLDGLS